jgi:hypothetical protein
MASRKHVHEEAVPVRPKQLRALHTLSAIRGCWGSPVLSSWRGPAASEQSPGARRRVNRTTSP